MTNFLYLASSQSEARTAQRACFLSRAFKTSFNPLTSPTQCRNRVQLCHQSPCRSERLPVHEGKRRYLPSFACDFLITLLMASLMLSALASSSISTWGISCSLHSGKTKARLTQILNHVARKRRKSHLLVLVVRHLFGVFVWLKCEICKWINYNSKSPSYFWDFKGFSRVFLIKLWRLID